MNDLPIAPDAAPPEPAERASAAGRPLRTPLHGALRTWTRDWGGVVALVCGAYLVAHAAWVLLKAAPSSHGAVARLLPLPLEVATLAVFWRAARLDALPSQTRRAWKLMALAMLILVVGDVSHLLPHQPGTRLPLAVELFHVLHYPCMFIALLSFPMASRTRAEWLKFWLDVTIVLIGVGMVVWEFVLRPLLSVYASQPSALRGLVYALGDPFLLLGVLTVALRRPEARSRGALALVAVGLLAHIAYDLTVASLSVQAHYPGGQWPDVLWMVALYGMLLGGQYQRFNAARPHRPDPDDAPGVRPYSVPSYIAILLGYGSLLLEAYQQWVEPLSLLVVWAVALTIVVVLRQVATVYESTRLREEWIARRSEARFRALVQHASDLITVVSADGTIQYQSPSARRVLDHDPNELLGSSVTSLLHPDDAPHAVAFLRDVAIRPGTSQPVEWRVHHRRGSWRYVEVVATNLLDDPTVHGIVLNMHDITERKALERQLAHQAFHDPLTNLANRALFRERVAHAVARQARDGRPFAVLFLDLNNFKTINDSLGHAAGDQALVVVAQRLRTCVRQGDTVARLGGDEFALLIEGIDGQSDAEIVAERILDALRHPIFLHGKEVAVSGSIGIATSYDQSASDELLRNADVAMYTAKARGNGHYAVFEPMMHVHAVERIELESDLRRALANHEFVVHYQPIVHLKTGRVEGVEALVRWQHPRRGLLLPHQFIPIAEDTGLIVPLGRWVLRQACRQMAEWHAEHFHTHPLFVSVNLSARQFQEASLADDVAQALQDAGLEPRWLMLELTESAVLRDHETVSRTLRKLSELGVRLAIDDFGTGYSSFAYLQEFPIHSIKIAKTFVDMTRNSADHGHLMQAITMLGSLLQLQVVAEGVEEFDQIDRLARLGCDFAQGYYFAQPLGPEHVRHLIENGWPEQVRE